VKNIDGIWIPDNDQHFVKVLRGAPKFQGKATYQLAKLNTALQHCGLRRHAVDVGGHVGLWSRVLAAHFAQVTAFEPLPPHIECFKVNVTAPNVTLLETAIGREAATIRIFMPHDNTGHAHVETSADTGLGEGYSVPCIALDQIGHEVLEDVDFLKIDVEGFELDVVLGAEGLIKRRRPTMVVEQKPGNAEALGRGQWDAVKLLKDWGAREIVVMAGDHILKW
jgi:FkbM family methyltransferase